MKNKVKLIAYSCFFCFCAFSAGVGSAYATSNTPVNDSTMLKLPPKNSMNTPGNIVPSSAPILPDQGNASSTSVNVLCPDVPICPDINGNLPKGYEDKENCPPLCYVQRILQINGVNWYDFNKPAIQPFSSDTPISDMQVVKQPICPAGYALEGMYKPDWNVENNPSVKPMPYPILSLDKLQSYMDRGYSCYPIPTAFPATPRFQWDSNGHTSCTSTHNYGWCEVAYWNYPNSLMGEQTSKGTYNFLVNGAAGKFVDTPPFTTCAAGPAQNCGETALGSGAYMQCSMTYTAAPTTQPSGSGFMAFFSGMSNPFATPSETTQWYVGVKCSAESLYSVIVYPMFMQYNCMQPSGMQFSDDKIPTVAICSRVAHTWQNSGAPYEKGKPISNIGAPINTGN